MYIYALCLFIYLLIWHVSYLSCKYQSFALLILSLFLLAIPYMFYSISLDSFICSMIAALSYTCDLLLLFVLWEFYRWVTLKVCMFLPHTTLIMHKASEIRAVPLFRRKREANSVGALVPFGVMWVSFPPRVDPFLLKPVMGDGLGFLASF